jgi:IS605 OrfB family transposase
MILIESHYIKPSHQSFIHCDWISYIVKNLRNSSNYHIRQHIFNVDKKKKALIGLSSVCGLDMQKYMNKSSFLDNDNNWIFNSTTLYHNLKNNPEFRTDTHTEYLELHQQNTEHIKAKIDYYNNLTLQDYINNRINSLNKRNNKDIILNSEYSKDIVNVDLRTVEHSKVISTKNKIKKLKQKINLKSFAKWKNKKIAKLKQQFLPTKINTKILKQTFRELNQNYSDYFKSLKEYQINPTKYKGLSKLPGYKPKGSTGRATVTIPIEAISNHFTKKDKLQWLEQGINIDNITNQYLNQNKEVYFYTLANFNILIQSHIPKEQIKEIKIVPQTLGYKICVIYDRSTKQSKCNAPSDDSLLSPCDDNSIEKSKSNEFITEKLQNSNFKNDITQINSSYTNTATKQSRLKTKEKKNKPHEKGLTLNKIKELVKESKVIAGADLGLNNTVTIVTTTPKINPIKINGRVMKSINQYYNKSLASKKSELSFTSMNNALTSHSIKSLTQKRNNQIHNILHQMSSYVVNWLKTNHIEALIVGYNENWKVEVNTGSKNNQNFVQIPFLKLINQLRYKCELAGIVLVLTEESYTSKASFLDLDKIPTYQEGIKNEVKFTGKRVKRGLYKSSTGLFINSDVNGAYNILRKVIGDAWVKTYTNSIKDYAINPIAITSCFGQFSYKTRKSNKL